MLVLLFCSASLQLPGGAWESTLQIPTNAPGESYVGECVIMAPDLDRDGIADVAYSCVRSGTYQTDAVVLVSGATGAALATHQRPTGGAFGSALAFGSDLNHDGFPEVYVGAKVELNVGSNYVGAVYVLSGRDLTQLQRWTPHSDSSWFGTRLANLGDQDGDLVDDFAVSAPANDDVEIRSGVNGALLVRISSTGNFGQSLCSVPDLDGDGKQDLIASAPDLGIFTGSVVAYGSRNWLELWHTYGLHQGSFLGRALHRAGDVNRDGKEDVVATEPQSRNGSNRGQIHLISGADGSRLAMRQPPVGFDLAPVSPAVLGGADLDGDGFLDATCAAQSQDESQLSIQLLLVHWHDDGYRLLNPPSTQSFSYAWSLSLYREHPRADVAQLIVGDPRAIPSRPGFAGGIALERWRFAPMLHLNRSVLHAHQGSSIEVQIDFFDSAAGMPYVLLASSSGTGPSVFASQRIPLAQDALFARMLHAPPSMITGERGVLDAHGNARAFLNVPPGAASAWVGRRIHFAAICGSGGVASGVSVARALQVLP